jgi:hypothetical protein
MLPVQTMTTRKIPGGISVASGGMPLSWCSFPSSTPAAFPAALPRCCDRARSDAAGGDTDGVTDHPHIVDSHVQSLLEHDRSAVQRLSVELSTELLPVVVRDDAPGWQGLARRSFDLRCEGVAADVRRVSATLDDISALLAGAIGKTGSVR